MTKRHLVPLLLLAALLALVAAGCGGGASADDAAPADADAKALRWAECMRKNGANVPDPQVDENGKLTISGAEPQQQSPSYAKAMAACRDLFDQVRPEPAGEMSAEERERFLAGALRYARCMRGQGVAMPDPSPRRDEAAISFPEGVDLDSPAYKKAAAACDRLMPNEID